MLAALDTLSASEEDVVPVPLPATLYVLSRLCRVVTHAPLLTRLADALLAPNTPRRVALLRMREDGSYQRIYDRWFASR